MKPMILALTALALTACAPDQVNYAGQPGAPQALAVCRAQSWQLAANAVNPMMVGAMQAQYIQDCMRASGFQMR